MFRYINTDRKLSLGSHHLFHLLNSLYFPTVDQRPLIMLDVVQGYPILLRPPYAMNSATFFQKMFSGGKCFETIMVIGVGHITAVKFSAVEVHAKSKFILLIGAKKMLTKKIIWSFGSTLNQKLPISEIVNKTDEVLSPGDWIWIKAANLTNKG